MFAASPSGDDTDLAFVLLFAAGLILLAVGAVWKWWRDRK